MGVLVGYARVSTTDQRPDLQADALSAAGCVRVFADTASGALDARPALSSCMDCLDTNSAGGRLVFHIFGALAEFERDLIRERTLAGLAAAKARGHVGGRPTVMTAQKLKTARKLLASGDHATDAVAQAIGVGRSTLYRHLGSDHDTREETDAA
jgi:DNA invertase Pin-like site-specific DNA recombinase